MDLTIMHFATSCETRQMQSLPDILLAILPIHDPQVQYARGLGRVRGVGRSALLALGDGPRWPL